MSIELNREEQENSHVLSVFFIAGSLLLTLGFERVPFSLPVEAAAIPAYTLFTLVIATPVLLYQRRLMMTPLSKIIVLFVVYMVCHSMLGVMYDLHYLDAGKTRIVAWIRQVISISAGITVFFVTREITKYQSEQRIIKLCLLAAVPPLLIGSMTATTAFTDVSLPGLIADVIRQRFELRPLNRSSGLSLEPSHFGYYLATGVAPFLIAAYYTDIRDSVVVAGSLGVVVSFAGAASVTSGLVMAGLFGSAVLFGPKRALGIVVTLGLLLGGISLVLFAPNSYPAGMITDLLTGEWNLSISTRAWSTLGPFRAYILTPRAILGYGLGGTSVHLSTLVPQSAIGGIRGVTYNQMPNLNSMLGRVLADGGVIGGLLFLGIFRTALRQALQIRRYTGMNVLMRVAPLSLGALAVGSALGYGSFALPYLWLWLALIDVQYTHFHAEGNGQSN